MYKILTMNEIAQRGLDEFPKERFTISDAEQNPDGILIRSQGLEVLPASLKAIARAGSVVSNIPVENCAKKGIVVFNTPGANAISVKELVLAGLFLSSRDIVGGIEWTKIIAKEGHINLPEFVYKNNTIFAGPEVSGKTLGVVGLGAIGVLVANVCRNLGMRVIGYDPYISIDAAWNLSRGVRKADDLDAILPECDYLTAHIPFNMETKGMFNSDIFAKCKKGVRMLNFSHAKIVESSDLKKAIKAGIISRYVTDFPTEEIVNSEFGVDKIVALPNLGATTPESRENCAAMASSQLREYLLYGNIKNSVNFPDCEIPYIGKKRICIIHRNVAKVVGPITGIFADRDINIDNMLNRSGGEYSYTMLDVDCDNIMGIEEELLKIPNIIKVRVI